MTERRELHGFYGFTFKLIFAKMNPESAHHFVAAFIRFFGLGPIGWAVRAKCRPAASIQVTALGLTFPSPFGMAAGFDKDATMIMGLGNLGFGHVEVGTLTAHAQPGNPKPRLFRLLADRALINRMGFNNHGSAAAVARLVKARGKKHRPIIGVNIGKSRVTEVEHALDDYVTSTRLLASLADYLVVNVSSPNTPGLRGLQEIDQLEPLLTAVQREAGGTPLLVKIAPDLSDAEVKRIAQMAVRIGLQGIIATNTTLSREGLATPLARVEEIGAGGLSGAPVQRRSVEVLKVIRTVVPDEFCVISVGGVEISEDVIERLDAGATLVQGYTAFIYQGPDWVRRINHALAIR